MHTPRYLQFQHLVIPLILLLTVSGKAQDIVRVVSPDSEIVTQPGLPASPNIIAHQGDVFELTGFQDGWAGIKMFSGSVRFIRQDDVQTDYLFISEYLDFTEYSGLCDEVLNVQSLASEKAGTRYPKNDFEPGNDTKRNALKKLLLDKYVLNIFREYQLPAIHNTIFTDCFFDSL